MERLKTMKESLMGCVQSQMGNLQNVDAKELGEAIDMIKDLEEAIYYATITKAMEEKEKNGEHNQQMMMYPVMYYEPSDRGNNARGGGSRGYDEPMRYPGEDYRYDPYLEEVMNKRRGVMYYSNGGQGNSGSSNYATPVGVPGEGSPTPNIGAGNRKDAERRHFSFHVFCL
jgi:hypothetical protein